MPKLFITGIVLFLLLGAGYGAIQAARSIPWDCSDWQAFAHDDRTTAILETLAENRGKTLYCGIDQSDTFTKAETWAAGRDHNERDDTVYWGEGGSFRGFIAAQEGWLTEGESGITGQSIATIFEFPKEKKRRVKRVKRIRIGTDPAKIADAASCYQPFGLVCSGWGDNGNAYPGHREAAARHARWRSAGVTGGHSYWEIDWETNIVWNTNVSGRTTSRGITASPNTAGWLAGAAILARNSCAARNLDYVAGSAEFGPGHSDPQHNGHNDGRQYDNGDDLGWFVDRVNPLGDWQYRAQQSRTWTALCKKVVRRSR